MSRAKNELAQIIETHLFELSSINLPLHHQRTLSAISRCRTAALGGHIDGCDRCGHLRISYNSCRNRHCPKCQGLSKEMWIVQQEDMLLPVAYFHVVFTLPHELNKLCLHYPKLMYGLLFKSAWHTLKTLSLDNQWLGARPAATMLLHTWSQTLGLHPHVHCIVPNGGIDKSGQWRYPKRGKANFLYPVVAMKKLYRGYFMEHMLAMLNSGELCFPEDEPVHMRSWKNVLYTKDWVVYAKKPFSGVKHVVDYLARYSHRVAITNRRIVSMKDGKVSFSYKSYRKGGKRQVMTLEGREFLRRFTMHILPRGFRKVRQYGFVSNASKAKSLVQARKALKAKSKILLTRSERKALAKERLFPDSVHRCPRCEDGKMQAIMAWLPNKDPPNIDRLQQIPTLKL